MWEGVILSPFWHLFSLFFIERHDSSTSINKDWTRIVKQDIYVTPPLSNNKHNPAMKFSLACVILSKFAKIRKSGPFAYLQNLKFFCGALGDKDRYIHQRHIVECIQVSMAWHFHVKRWSGDDHSHWIWYGIFPLSIALVGSRIWAVHIFYGYRWIYYSKRKSNQRAAMIDDYSGLSRASVGIE